MNVEQQLELQAWVDGELSADDARRVAEFVNASEEARALVNELRVTKSFLVGNEPAAALSESREFYWSKIQREIKRQEKAAARPEGVSWLFAWRKLMAPITGLALIAFFSILSLNYLRMPALDDGSKYLVEVENLSEDIGSISYRSQSENMFVVYLYKKDQDTESDLQAEPADDSFFQ
jgi:hypothetical protein